MKNEVNDIVNRMILIRKLLGLSQKELADVIGYSPSMVRKVENGDRSLSVDYFRAFCRELGISADFMISGNLRKFNGA